MALEPRTLRVVIVDDEELARRGLARDLAGDAALSVVAECADGFEAVRVAVEQKPDLMLLDIQMPRLDGFEVAELLDPAIAVIFVTAHDEHALRAFEVHAVDYVLKPVGRERLAEALAQARSRIAGAAGGPPPSPAALMASARRPGQFLERLIVKDGAHVHVIPVDRVDRIEAQDDYVAIHTGGETLLKAQTLAEVGSGLDPARFVRVHRSHVLNVERLARLEVYAKDSRVAILVDGKTLPVSRAGYARLRELL